MSIFLKQNVCRSPVSYIFYNFRRGQEEKEKEDLTAIRVCYIDTCIYTYTYIYQADGFVPRWVEGLNLTLGCTRVPVVDGAGVEV